MKLPALPEDWFWDKVFEVNWAGWSFRLYDVDYYDEYYQSITLQIGPFIWCWKSRHKDDKKV